MSALSKVCPKCGKVKPASDFGRNKALPDGPSFYCLHCNRERDNRWYRESRQAIGKQVRDHSWVPEGFRWCPDCKQAVAHKRYTRNAATTSGFGSRCKACHNAAGSAAYFYRTYRLTKADVEEFRIAQGDRCAICAEPAPQHLDMIMPAETSASFCVNDAITAWGCSATIPICCMSLRCTSRGIASNRPSPPSWTRRAPGRTGPAPGAPRR